MASWANQEHVGEEALPECWADALAPESCTRALISQDAAASEPKSKSAPPAGRFLGLFILIAVIMISPLAIVSIHPTAPGHKSLRTHQVRSTVFTTRASTTVTLTSTTTTFTSTSCRLKEIGDQASAEMRNSTIFQIKVVPGRDGGYQDWTPLRVVEAGVDNISLVTSRGTYVSARMDGTLDAFSASAGNDEIFKMVSAENNSSALKTTFGKFLQIAKDGTVTADGDGNGSTDRFTQVSVGGDVTLQREGQVIAAVGNRLSLLTTAYLSTNPHTQEQFAALVVNLMNEYIYDVHVITECDCNEILAELERWISRMPNSTLGRTALHRKFVCVPSPTGVQPLYKDFFEYANTGLRGHLVLFANGDIAFDETLRRIEPESIVAGKISMVLSVQPPPSNGIYKGTFGFECSNTPRCAVGSWQGGFGGSAGLSWDAYIFASPLPSGFNPGEVDVVMNIYGAEQVAAFQFEARAGLTLYNPCYHVHAFHWHCQGGKTHSLDHAIRVDKWPHRAAKGILPCWTCSGVSMPPGSAKSGDLCRLGNLQWLPSSTAYFIQPQITVNVCCSNPGTCNSLPLQWLPTCRDPNDVDCVIWEFNGKHVYY